MNKPNEDMGNVAVLESKLEEKKLCYKINMAIDFNNKNISGCKYPHKKKILENYLFSPISFTQGNLK